MMATAYDQSGTTRGESGFAHLLTEVDPTDGEVHVVNHIAEPERRLFFAVLTDAIVRFRRLVEAPHAAMRQECLEAERWIRSADREWPCSFVNVCEALDIEPEPLRQALLRWRRPGGARRSTRRSLMVKDKRPRRGEAESALVGAAAIGRPE